MGNKLKEFFIKDKFLLFIISGILINIFCFCIASCDPLIVHAASDVSSRNFPYIVPQWVNANSCVSDYMFSLAEERYISDVRNYFRYQGDLSYLVYLVSGPSQYNIQQIFFITNPTVNLSVIDSFDYSNNVLSVNSNNVQIIAVNFDISTGRVVGDAINLGNNVNLLGNYSTTAVSTGNVTPYYPFKMVGVDEIFSSNDVLIFSNNVPVVVPDAGHAQNPMDNIPTFVPPLGMHPQSAPTVPSYTFPSIQTAPTFDPSSPVQSVWDYIKWGFTFLGTLLQGIIQNIIDWFTFIGELIVWLYEQLWNYITFFIDWLYRIFEYLFSPLYNFLKALFHEGDETVSIGDLLFDIYSRLDSFTGSYFPSISEFFDDVIEQIELVIAAIDNLRIAFTTDSNPSIIVQGFTSTYLGRLLNAIKTLGTGLVSIFTDITAPDVLSFTINFSDAPAPFNNIEILSFNFGWYNNIRDIVVPIIVTCIYVGFGFNLFFKIPGIISGMPGSPLVTFDTQPVPTIDPPYPGQKRIGNPGTAGKGFYMK